MRAELLLLLFFAGPLMAGPARRDCGETKSFIGTNSCDETYGGTWIECATGVSNIPTFVVPTCLPTPTSAIAENTEPTIELFVSTTTTTTTTSEFGPLVTAPPNYNDSSIPTWSNTTSCSPLWICIDCLAVCGTVSKKYGDCYDTCFPKSITSPECTLPSSLPTATPSVDPEYTITAPELGLVKAPIREEKAWCLGKSWMCAPKGWF